MFVRVVQVFGQGDSETASDNVGPYHIVMNYEWSYEAPNDDGLIKRVTEVSYSCNLYQWSLFTLLIIGDFGPTLIICYFYSSFQAEMIHVIGGWG